MNLIHKVSTICQCVLVILAKYCMQIIALSLMSGVQWLAWGIYKINKNRVGIIILFLYIMIVTCYVLTNLTPPGSPSVRQFPLV